MESIEAHPNTGLTLQFPSAVNSRVGRRLPSEGKGHTFESCRVRQIFFYSAICAPGLELQLCLVRASKQRGRKSLRGAFAPAPTEVNDSATVPRLSAALS